MTERLALLHTARSGVNWTLLGIAGVIVVMGAAALYVWFRRRRRRQRIEALRRPDTAAQAGHITGKLPAVAPGVSPQQAYDAAMAGQDFLVAARWAQKMRAPRLAAEALEKAGELERAVTAWVDLKELGRAAQLLERAGQPGKAARLYREAGASERAADCYVNAGDLDQAAKLLHAAGETHRAHLLEARSRIEAGELLAAARFLIAADAMQEAAEVLLKAGEPAKAAEALRRAGDTKGAAKIYLQTGDIKAAAQLFEEGRHCDAAAECYGRLGQIEDQVRCLAAGGHRFRAGHILFDRGALKASLALMEAIGPLEPHYTDASLLRGQMYERMGRPEDAATAYELFLKELSPDNRSRVLFLRAAQLREGLGQQRAALGLLGRVLTAGLATPDVTAWATRLERATAAAVETEAFESSPAEMGLRRRASSPGRLRIPTRFTDPKERKSSGIRGLPDFGDSTDDDPPAIQSLARRYKFHGRIGQGGNGVVYQATDRALGREVVVKFLHQALLPTDVARRYFEREAKTAARLTHPNIVTIFDIGQEEDTLYYSMELVDGQTLADLIVDHGGTLSPELALPIISQLCSALDYAHEAQVIHRDIKPGNIMVNSAGKVKLLDFGLAKALDENPDKSVFLCGTPFYMSPEQIRRDFLDHRTDLYSLGCLLYVIYTGDVPFPEGNVFQHHQKTAPPSPKLLNPSLPDGLDQILIKSVSKDREQRFQRALAVSEAIAAVTG